MSQTGDEVSCHKDLVTKQLWCNGLELSDFKYVAPKLDILELETNNNKLESLHFIPHMNPSLQVWFKSITNKSSNITRPIQSNAELRY